MNPRIVTALAASAFVHGAVFAALLLIEGPRVAEGEPAPVSVTLRPLPSNADQDAGAALASVPDAPFDASEPPDAPPSLVDAREIMRPTPPSVVPEEFVMTRPSVPVDVDTIADIEMPAISDPVVALSDVLVTDAPSRRVAVATANRSAPAAKRLPIPRDELRMLNDKLAQWTEALSVEEALEPSHSWEHDGRVFTASVREIPPDSDMGVDRKLVEISTTVGGERFMTELSLKQLAFSSFAQFIDRWDPEVQIHDDVVDGRFHSNSEIQVSSSGGVRPTFLGRVTTSSRRVNTSSSRGRVDRDEMFVGGLETGVRRISLPRDFSPTVRDARSGVDTRVIDADAHINFYADGSFGWRYLEGGDSEHREAIDGILYVVADPKVELHIKGVVNGTVLVYSPDDIVIEGELIYADDPLTEPEADDYLGLVSEKSIEVAGPKITGDGDLRIQAAIYARRRFAVRSYRTRQEATLRLFGSLTAGSVSATEPRFATEIRFDPRLEDTRPPSFPVTSRYEIDGWTEQWRVEPLLGER